MSYLAVASLRVGRWRGVPGALAAVGYWRSQPDQTQRSKACRRRDDMEDALGCGRAESPPARCARLGRRRRRLKRDASNHPQQSPEADHLPSTASQSASMLRVSGPESPRDSLRPVSDTQKCSRWRSQLGSVRPRSVLDDVDIIHPDAAPGWGSHFSPDADAPLSSSPVCVRRVLASRLRRAPHGPKRAGSGPRGRRVSRRSSEENSRVGCRAFRQARDKGALAPAIPPTRRLAPCRSLAVGPFPGCSPKRAVP